MYNYIMTKKQYANYEAAVAKFMFLEGIDDLTTESDAEPYFAWSRCDCCNSPLGGNREHATGYNRTTKQVQEYEICQDCAYYAAYGRLDDTTMGEIA